MLFKRVYRYRVYGLNIESYIKLKELVTISKGSEIDVKIYKGNLDKVEFKPDRDIKFSIVNVGRFAIIDNKEVIVEASIGATADEIKAYLIQTVMSIVLYRRNCIPVHGGAISIGDKSVLIVGESGAGKSSLTTALRRKGYGFIADDLACIEIKDEPMCMPTFPYQNLCRDTANNFGYDVSKLKVIDTERDKYRLDVKESFINKPVPVGAIFEIRKSDCKKVEVREVIGKEKLSFVLNNMYTSQITNSLGVSNRVFKKCIELSNSVPYFIIYRPENLFTVDDQIKIIEDIVTQDLRVCI